MTRITFVVALLLFSSVLSAQEKKIGDITDGSQSRKVHVIRLIDDDSSTIWLDEQPLMPFSTRNTCGACHDYEKISEGWHFNAGETDQPPGRAGQPWIWSDPAILTQLPLSYRNWPGMYDPDSIGIKPFEFVGMFGHHSPGGGVGEDTARWDKENLLRWWISGPSEVNCLGCHNASPAYDPSEYAAQMVRQNFRWAPTAASAIASVTGSARDMPDSYDIYSGSAPDVAQKQPPVVSYDATRFDRQSKVFFDITIHMPDQNCLFCHSQVRADSLDDHSGDVHIRAGLHCVDCHSNGLDHMIDRGIGPGGNSCKNCHYQTGRYGAPKPEHAGLPLVHLEELACTTCHSGPKPGQETRRFKTSMAHALGLHGITRSPDQLPHVQAPVYAFDSEGKLSPFYLMWPSFWGNLKGKKLKPLNPMKIREIASGVIGYIDSLGTGSWPQVSDSLIYQILDTLRSAGLAADEPVFTAGGKIFRQADRYGLKEIDAADLGPDIWPLAHDVRPASQSLGSEGCNECHGNTSAFFFSLIKIDSPLPAHRHDPVTMSVFQQKSSLQRRIFAASFLFRPWLKGLLIALTSLPILLIFIYIFRGINAVMEYIKREEQ